MVFLYSCNDNNLLSKQTRNNQPANTCCGQFARAAMAGLLQDYKNSTDSPDPNIIRKLDPLTCDPSALELFERYCEGFQETLSNSYSVDYDKLLNGESLFLVPKK